MILKLRSLFTSTNGLRLDYRTVESIAAYNRKRGHNLQEEKLGARFSQLAWVRILLDVNGEPSRHPVTDCPVRLRLEHEYEDEGSAGAPRLPYIGPNSTAT